MYILANKNFIRPVQSHELFSVVKIDIFPGKIFMVLLWHQTMFDVT